MNESQKTILKVAIEIAKDVGFRKVTRKSVADRAHVAAGTISYYYPTMAHLHDAVMEHAVARGNHTIVAQGLIDGHRAAKNADAALKRAALRTLAE